MGSGLRAFGVWGLILGGFGFGAWGLRVCGLGIKVEGFGVLMAGMKRKELEGILQYSQKISFWISDFDFEALIS